MGTSPPVYSSVSGPAKWAAVVILTAACSAGLTYSLVARQPRAAHAASPPVKELPPRRAYAAPTPAPAASNDSKPLTSAAPP